MYEISPKSNIFGAPTDTQSHSGGQTFYFGGNPNLAMLSGSLGQWQLPLLIGAGLLVAYLLFKRR